MNRIATVGLYFILVSKALTGEVLEDTIEKTVPLNSTGTLSLRAIDGSVEIYGATRNEVQITAIRKAFSPERINQIQVRVEGDENAVQINTVAPPKPRWGWSDRSGTVDYLINLPQTARITAIDLPAGELIVHGMRGAGISASLGNGRLTSHNCFCDQKLRVQSGALDLFFDWSEQRPITVDGMIIDGNARAVIPGDASFELHAASVYGHVASDFTEMVNRRRGGVSEINETIGPAPLSRLALRTTRGNISISETTW